MVGDTLYSLNNQGMLEDNYLSYKIPFPIAWDEIHPEHLKLVLRGVKNYNNSSLLKELLIEIFKNYSIL